MSLARRVLNNKTQAFRSFVHIPFCCTVCMLYIGTKIRAQWRHIGKRCTSFFARVHKARDEGSCLAILHRLRAFAEKGGKKMVEPACCGSILLKVIYALLFRIQNVLSVPYMKICIVWTRAYETPIVLFYIAFVFLTFAPTFELLHSRYNGNVVNYTCIMRCSFGVESSSIFELLTGQMPN